MIMVMRRGFHFPYPGVRNSRDCPYGALRRNCDFHSPVSALTSQQFIATLRKNRHFAPEFAENSLTCRSARLAGLPKQRVFVFVYFLFSFILPFSLSVFSGAN